MEGLLRVLVLGGSGATGRCLIPRLIANSRVGAVVNIGRKVYDHLPEDSKFEQVVAPDMSDLSSVKLPHEAYDIAFCTLGTTRADAGSDAAFKLVDYTYVMEFAKLCKKLEVRSFQLMSSVGADKDSWFLYPQTKGRVEHEVKELQFLHSCAYQAPLLDRGDEARKMEKIGKFFMPSMTVDEVAQCMVLYGLSKYPASNATKPQHETLYSSKMPQTLKELG